MVIFIIFGDGNNFISIQNDVVGAFAQENTIVFYDCSNKQSG